MTVVALANKKGGVGKTTMTIELASGFAIGGKKVLMIWWAFGAGKIIKRLQWKKHSN